MAGRCITDAEVYLRRGQDWDSLPPQDGPTAPALNINRLNRLGLAAWSKLDARFGIGAGIDIDLATGRWTDARNRRTGVGVVALVAHIARSTIAEAAAALMRVIKVRRRQPAVVPAKVEDVAPVAETITTDIAEPVPPKTVKPSANLVAVWLGKLRFLLPAQVANTVRPRPIINTAEPSAAALEAQ